MRKITIIGANSSLAKSFASYLDKKSDIKLRLYGTHLSNRRNEKDYHYIDFSDKVSLNQIDYDCDQMYIFSGLTGTVKGFEQYSEYIDINEKYLVSLLDSAVKNNARCRIIYPSSRLVYKSTGEKLFENSELECRSIYAVNKVAAEQYIKVYSNVYDINFTIFRIAIPFGAITSEETQYGIVSTLKKQAQKNGVITLYGDGKGLRTFTHIGDICSALYYGGSHEKTNNEVFNIGGYTCSLKELAELIAKRYNAEIKTVHWPVLDGKVDVPDGWLDSTKLDSVIKIKYKNFYTENY